MAQILIIEDDIQFRPMLEQMLTSQGYQVISSENGIQGMEQFRRHQPALVITDILMPEKDGIETILEIKRESPSTRIIAISGGRRSISPKFSLDSATLLGVDSVLAKPFTRQQLLDTIRNVLR
jgi:DNA-binding response OmpR family regulator